MARRRRTFTAEFKSEAVKLCRAGDRTVAQVAKALDLPSSVLQEWLDRAKGTPARVNPKRGQQQTALPQTFQEQEQEILRLRAEVKRLERNEDILKKAAAFFAKEKM